MLASGVELKVTSELLGRSNIGITAELYMHVSQKLHQDAAERLNRLLK